MGSTYSQEDVEQICSGVYTFSKMHSWLPDIGIDDSLLKYSSPNSNSKLQTYSNDLINSMPGYVDRLASTLAPMTSVPNAVGLGALVLSMIMEICIKSTLPSNDDSYSMLQRVFGEEKASTVRNTMLEYLKRHEMFINNQQRLQEELQRLEKQLSGHLTTLRTSLQDGQMSTRGFKIWVNGASFHVQMLVHQARLNNPTGQKLSQDAYSISAAINTYVKDLKDLLEKYKDFKISKTSLYCSPGFTQYTCCMEDLEFGWKFNHCFYGSDFATEYIEYVFSHDEAITGLRTHFLTVKNNLKSLINQRYTFSLRSRA